MLSIAVYILCLVLEVNFNVKLCIDLHSTYLLFLLLDASSANPNFRAVP